MLPQGEMQRDNFKGRAGNLSVVSELYQSDLKSTGGRVRGLAERDGGWWARGVVFAVELVVH